MRIKSILKPVGKKIPKGTQWISPVTGELLGVYDGKDFKLPPKEKTCETKPKSTEKDEIQIPIQSEIERNKKLAEIQARLNKEMEEKLQGEKDK